MDEYKKLYYEFYGFEFLYHKNRLSKSRPMSADEVMDISERCRNTDTTPIFVKCRDCDEYMEFDGKWYSCKNCGSRIKERTVYSKLDQESQEKFGNDYNKYY